MVEFIKLRIFFELTDKNSDMLKIGLFATGLDTYWSQFDGLLDHLNDYRRIIAGRINAAGADIECAVAGECEVKNAQAMKIMSLLGAGGSFSEEAVLK